MRFARLVCLLTAFAALFAGVSFSPVAKAETISVRADAWPPYNGDPKAADPGYGIEILKAIFEKQGYTIDYQTMPWNRALQEVKEGKFSAAIGASTEDGAGMVFPEESVGKMDTYFFVKKGNAWTYKGIDSLKSVKLGVIDEYDYGSAELNAWIKEKKGTPEVQAVSGDDAVERNIQKLIAGRMDVMVECKPVVDWTLKKMKIPADDIKNAGSLGNPTDIFVVFSPAKPDSKKLADMFSAGMKSLRQSGELKKILDKYNLQDWK